MSSIPVFKPGEYLSVQKVVERADTGAVIGSGKLAEVLASPMLLNLMIEASTRLIDARLEDDLISVGKSYTINHEAPTLIGETVTCKMTIKSQEQNRILLEMEAYDETGLVGTGSCERYIANPALVVKTAKSRIDQTRPDFSEQQ